MQGVVKAFDPATGSGSLLAEPALTEIELAENALDGTIFRFLRQGQRLNFDLDAHGHAIKLRFGSEPDMATQDSPSIACAPPTSTTYSHE